MTAKILFLVAVLLFVSAWACSPAGTSNDVVVGEETHVCVVLSPLKWGAKYDGSGNVETVGKYLSISATLTADEFSTIKINDAWTSTSYANDTAMATLGSNATNAADMGLGVSVGSMNVPSDQKAYRRIDQVSSVLYGRTFPILMAIVRVDAGVVKEVLWDDACNWCTDAYCAQNTYSYNGTEIANDGPGSCFVEDSSCVVSGSETFNPSSNVRTVSASPLCGLKVYVTWTGTDKNGFHFLSAASRFSRLSETQMTSFVNDF